MDNIYIYGDVAVFSSDIKVNKQKLTFKKIKLVPDRKDVSSGMTIGIKHLYR